MNESVREERSEQRPDMTLLLVILCLVAIGTVMVYSSSSMLAVDRFDSSSFFLKRQLIRVLVGIAIMFLVMSLDYRRFAGKIKISVPISLIMLIFVLGTNKVRGASSYWDLGPVTFQPSEIVKVIIVFYFADSMARRREKMQEFTYGYLPHLLILGITFFLVVAQPDLGTAIMIGLIGSIMIFLGRVKLRYLVGTVLVLFPVMYILVYGVGYRKARVESFLHKHENARRARYQITQSLVGLGSGGLTGTGLGQSKQKFFFLPEPHTDFVFSIIGEEFGFVGTALTLFLFLIFGWRGVQIAREASDPFGFFLALGITIMIISYAFLNIAVVTDLVPTTGIPLPFISYGGSSMVLALFSSGVLLSISRFRNRTSEENPANPGKYDRTKIA